MNHHDTHIPVPSELSLISVHATAIDVCYSVYGDTSPSFDTIDRFYETDAMYGLVTRLAPRTDPCFRYENPFLTATSRSIIADIFKLSRQLSTIDIPRPLAVIYTLFRLQPPRHLNNPLFRALRVWTDVGDISETGESFDGHRKVIVEHNLNMLVLPGLHVDPNTHVRFQPSEVRRRPSSASSSWSLEQQLAPPPPPNHPSLPVPGTSLYLPSPFHFRLHIITRLSFNEQGKVTHHRDFWDIKDVMGLVPGVSLAQWIGTRLAAKTLTCLAGFWSHRGSDAEQQQQQHEQHDKKSAAPLADIESGRSPVNVTPAQAYATVHANGLSMMTKQDPEEDVGKVEEGNL